MKLKRVVERLLNDRHRPADAVIALTDVYTGSQPPDFETAEDAKGKMQEWVGDERRFYPHVALHDYEAWLLPYCKKIQQLAGNNRKVPGYDPEGRSWKTTHTPTCQELKAFLSTIIRLCDKTQVIE